jgi:hypothetical protein
MVDRELHGRLLRLADAIRNIPDRNERPDLVAAFEAIVWHLQRSGQIPPGPWMLAPRRPEH